MSELEDRVEDLDIEIPNRGYWYLRTDGGEYYNEFKTNNYVAIGYNYVPINAIRNNNLDQIKNLITVNEDRFDYDKFEDLKRGEKSSVTRSANALMNFQEMNEGDVVIIPSSESSSFCIGIIKDTDIYRSSQEDLEECPFIHRRKVKWEKIDFFLPPYSPIIYSLKHTHSTLTKIEKYSEYINGALKPFFLQNDKYYLTIDIKRNEDIPLSDLRKLLNSYYNIISILNEEYGYNENVDEAVIKLNLNSKGIVNLIQDAANGTKKSLAAAAILLNLVGVGCTNTEIKNITGADDYTSEKLNKEITSLNEAKESLEIRD